MTCRLTWTRLLRRKRSPKAQDDLWEKTFSDTLKVISFYSNKDKIRKSKDVSEVSFQLKEDITKRGGTGDKLYE